MKKKAYISSHDNKWSVVRNSEVDFLMGGHNFMGANLQGSTITSNAYQIDFKYASLEEADASEIQFDRCKFVHADTTGSEFYDCVFNQCVFVGTTLKDTLFNGCIFNDCKILAVNARCAVFLDCQFNEVKMTGLFIDACFDGSKFVGSDANDIIMELDSDQWNNIYC